MSSLSAKVYSLERLDAPMKDSLANGLEIIGEHVGGISLGKFSLIRTPVTEHGVNLDDFRYGNFDPAIDLHVVVAPFHDDGKEPSSEILGISYHGTGVAWIKPAIGKQLTTTTTAHEVGHSLGYVLPDSPQAIKASDNHCSDQSCLMTAVAQHDPAYLRFVTSLGFAIDPEAAKNARKVESFCTPCRADMHATADENVDRIRRTRRLFKSVILRRLP